MKAKKICALCSGEYTVDENQDTGYCCPEHRAYDWVGIGGVILLAIAVVVAMFFGWIPS